MREVWPVVSVPQQLMLTAGSGFGSIVRELWLVVSVQQQRVRAAASDFYSMVYCVRPERMADLKGILTSGH